MAISKDKVLAAIEVKLKGKSASKNFKENIAAKWAEKIETEDDLDSFIEDREDVLIEACSEADRRVTAATAKAKEEAGKKPEDEKKPEEKATIPEDAPEWAKALIKQNETLASKLDTFESKQKAQSITERFNADPRVKDIPDLIRKGYMPTSEDDFEANVESLTGDYKVFAEKHKLAAHGNDTPGTGNVADATKPKQVTDDKAKEMAASLVGQN